MPTVQGMRGLLWCQDGLSTIQPLQSPTGSRQGCARTQGKRLEGGAPDYPPELPEMRREVLVVDYDSGAPVVPHWALYRTNCVDCYRVKENGIEWNVASGHYATPRRHKRLRFGTNDGKKPVIAEIGVFGKGQGKPAKSAGHVWNRRD
jgi:hypothetical protein